MKASVTERSLRITDRFGAMIADGVTDGSMLRGIHRTAQGASTHSIIMRSKTGTVRRFDSLQRWQDAIDFVAAHADGERAAAGFDAKISANKRDFEARFGKARVLMAQQQWTAAMDELLEILMRDKAWSDDLARKTYIAILDIIEPPKPKVAEGQIPPDDPVVASYRRRLSSVVLS